MPQAIRIEITKPMLARVEQFSRQVLDETYDRFQKDSKTRFDRIFVGKMGELVFSKFLFDRKIMHDTSSMFAIYQGTANVDEFDFVIPSTGETIDVKTAYKDFHSRIMVPRDDNGQWDQQPKDYYVGVKLVQCLNKESHVDASGNTSPYGMVFGYVPRSDPLWKGPDSFGEGPCMWVFLNSMHSLNGLIAKF